MARSTYDVPTVEQVLWVAHDGQKFDREAKARQHNARLAIAEICHENGWQGVVTAQDVADFIVDNMCAIAPWADDLNGD